MVTLVRLDSGLFSSVGAIRGARYLDCYTVAIELSLKGGGREKRDSESRNLEVRFQTEWT